MSSCSGWLRDVSVPPATAETSLGTVQAALLQQGALRFRSWSSLLINHECIVWLHLAHHLALRVEEQDMGV